MPKRVPIIILMRPGKDETSRDASILLTNKYKIMSSTLELREENEILKTQVAMTIVGGKVLFERK